MSAAAYPALPILRQILGLAGLLVVVVHVYKEGGDAVCAGRQEVESTVQGILELSDPRVVVANADPAGKWGRGPDYRWDWAEEAVRKGVKYVEA